MEQTSLAYEGRTERAERKGKKKAPLFILMLPDRLGLMEMDLDRNTLLVGRHGDIRSLLQNLVTTQVDPRGCITLTHKRQQVVRSSRIRRRTTDNDLSNLLNVTRSNVAVVFTVGRWVCLFEGCDEGLVDASAVSVYFLDGGLVVGEDHGVAVGDQGDGAALEQGGDFVERQ